MKAAVPAAAARSRPSRLGSLPRPRLRVGAMLLCRRRLRKLPAAPAHRVGGLGRPPGPGIAWRGLQPTPRSCLMCYRASAVAVRPCWPSPTVLVGRVLAADAGQYTVFGTPMRSQIATLKGCRTQACAACGGDRSPWRPNNALACPANCGAAAVLTSRPGRPQVRKALLHRARTASPACRQEVLPAVLTVPI